MSFHWKDWCWTWSSNALATWCEEPLMRKDPDAGKDWAKKRRGWQRIRRCMASPTQWTWVWESSGERQGSLECGRPWGCKESDLTEWLNNNYKKYLCFLNLLFYIKLRIWIEWIVFNKNMILNVFLQIQSISSISNERYWQMY